MESRKTRPHNNYHSHSNHHNILEKQKGTQNITTSHKEKDKSPVRICETLHLTVNKTVCLDLWSCSRLQSLKFMDIQDFPGLAPYLWKFCTSLKSLELWLRLDSPGLKFPGFDAALTGLPLATVSMMDCLNDPDFDEEVREDWVVESESLLNLKFLKVFSLVFYHGDWRTFSPNFRLLSSHVSGKLIFEPKQSQILATARVEVKDQLKKKQIEEALEPFAACFQNCATTHL